MITIEARFTGSELARSLTDDEEETFYFLQDFCGQDASQFAKDMADYASPAELVEFAEVFETWAKAFRDQAEE